MSWFTHTIERKDLKPGDHIYVWRFGSTYAHHGIFIGIECCANHAGYLKNKGHTDKCYQVMHYTGSNKKSTNPKDPSAVFVKQTNLEEFLKGGTLKKVQYGASVVSRYVVKRSGTCHVEESDPSDVVLTRVRDLSRCRAGLGKYNIFFCTTESMATWCKLGDRCEYRIWADEITQSKSGGALRNVPVKKVATEAAVATVGTIGKTGITTLLTSPALVEQGVSSALISTGAMGAQLMTGATAVASVVSIGSTAVGYMAQALSDKVE